tara:strand:- start:804 stop:1712 length:909 start_codon:yes stop_codon:yes gene_type:complete
MPAELIDIAKEFHLGNRFTLEVAEHLAAILDERYRIIVKYDQPDSLPYYNDSKLNIVFATSRETHDVPNEFFRKDVLAIFQHYFMLDKWGDPIFSPLVYPLPLGPFRDMQTENIKPLPERKYDFCFIGQIPHTGTRDYFKRNLDDLIEKTGDKFKYYVKFTSGFSGGLNPEEYAAILGDSKLSLCPQGANSFETFRFFESIMMGAIPVVETLPRFWYYEQAPHFNIKWRDIDSNLSQILNHIQTPQIRETLYDIGRYCNNTMNPQRLAEHLKDKIDIRVTSMSQHQGDIDRIRKELNELDTI